MKNLLFMLLVTSAAFAQRENLREKLDEVKAMKIAHITSELALTPDEAAKFWPVYNVFEQKERELRRDRISLSRKKRGQSEPISEKEAEAALEQLQQNEEELCRERKKYNAQLRDILPASKILKLNTAEDEFGRRLLRQYKAKGSRKK